jgi:large subunit ribosomal protein L17
MRHKKKRTLQNRFTSWRKSTLVLEVKNLLKYQSIKTSTRKAKAVKPVVEKLISLAKTNTLYAKRQAFKILGDHGLVSALFMDIGSRFAKTQSGFTRIIPLGKRRGDNAEISIFELTEIKKKEAKKPKKEKEVKPEEEIKKEPVKEKPIEEKKPEATHVAVKEKPPLTKKPSKKFLGGLRNIFKKERDSL